MNPASGPSLDDRLTLLASDILAWNSRINLVSRVDTRRLLDVMFRHCRDGWELVREALGERPCFRSSIYVDIGSGAGLPGLVWASLRDGEGHDGPSFLVEPRERRAWFLRRAARALALAGVEVVTMRWGDGPWMAAGPGLTPLLISMKALRMDDRHVLAGALAVVPDGTPDAQSPPEISILRFLAPEDRLRREETRHGQAAPEAGKGGREEVIGGRAYSLRESRILGLGVPRLGLRRYAEGAARGQIG